MKDGFMFPDLAPLTIKLCRILKMTNMTAAGVTSEGCRHDSDDWKCVFDRSVLDSHPLRASRAVRENITLWLDRSQVMQPVTRPRTDDAAPRRTAAQIRLLNLTSDKTNDGASRTPGYFQVRSGASVGFQGKSLNRK